MTLPSSGPISVSQIAAEFGVSLPCVFPDAFYGRPGVPASGALSFSQFYGLSNVTFTPDGGTVSDAQYGVSAQVQLSCSQSAVWTFVLPTFVTASISSGASATTIYLTLPIGMPGSSRSANFIVTGVAAGVSRNFTVNLVADYS